MNELVVGFTTMYALRKLEFSEGDIGIAGGLQVLEPASANPVTTDSIKRRHAKHAGMPRARNQITMSARTGNR